MPIVWSSIFSGFWSDGIWDCSHVMSLGLVSVAGDGVTEIVEFDFHDVTFSQVAGEAVNL